MDIPKRVHTGIDRWKMEQITNLYDGGHTLEDIADQVDLEDRIVREVIELARQKRPV
ncbi:MAG: hypothetical protein ABI347_01705 [Nitrososphaera sp.]|jgi:hypothetical protein